MDSFATLFPSLCIFPLHKIVNGRCGCDKDTCDDIGKHPAVRWSELGVAEKLRGEGGHGIATGERSGIFVVDIDSPDANDRFNALGECPATLTVSTPRGHHVYFKWPGFPVRGSASKLAKGVDVRGDGGYVVAPGSPHRSGGRYEVCDDVPVAEAPRWLLAWEGLRKPTRPKSVETLAPVPISEIDTAYGRWRLATVVRYLQECEISISGSGGRTTMFAICCALVRRQRLPIPLAIDALDMAYNPRLVAAGTEPWTLEEIEERLESARESGTTPEGWVMDETLWNELHAPRKTGS